jgi:hypothetical protein
VLIDVADDGQDRYLQIGTTSVDFTGTTKVDSTMMSLKAAPVRQRNRVLIKPLFWNEGLGKGSCVADTAGAGLTLETCETGRAAQVWQVRPAGDSGHFELHGVHGGKDRTTRVGDLACPHRHVAIPERPGRTKRFSRNGQAESKTH